METISRFIKKHNTAVIRCICLLILSLILTFITETVSRSSAVDALFWIGNYPFAFLFTSAFLFFVQFFLFTLFRRIDFPFLITGIFAFAMSVANAFKLSYRSEPLYPWDIFIASDAADITKEINLTPTVSMIVAAILIIAIFLFLFISHWILFKNGIFKKHKADGKRKLMLILQPTVSFICIVLYIFVSYQSAIMSFFGITESAFRQASACKRNGIIESFILNTQYINPEKPSDYSLNSVTEALSEIKSNTGEYCVRPNIIYLMSESYADISLCKNVTYYDNIFGCTDFLKENYVSGTLIGAQYGGGTCNSEFEVLTGFSTTYLPSGCTPYQQYLNKETVSYPRYLKSLGYSTVAIHSYGKQFWNRDVVYPNMGFDKFISEEDFVDPLRRRGLIKDDELVNMIISEYESNLSTGKPFFNFSVSMQNHGSFTNGQYLEDYRTNLSCDELSPEQQGILTTYATGIRDANIALDKLISYFQNTDEPTIIVMFGDHLGSLGGSDEIYIKSGYMNDPEKNPEDMAKKYSTPFFVWDNFTDNNFSSEKMSFYQLIPSICNWYNLERPGFFDYLFEQQQYFRGSNALGLFIDETGNAGYELSDKAKKYYDIHKLFQYDLMFGKKYGADKLYK